MSLCSDDESAGEAAECCAEEKDTATSDDDEEEDGDTESDTDEEEATGAAGPGAAGGSSAAAAALPDGARVESPRVLPQSVNVSCSDFRRFELPRSPSEDPGRDYQKALRDYFTGQIEGQSEHDWTEEMRSLSKPRAGHAPPAALSVWQAAGYKHAQKVLKDKVLKGCLFWWSCGSGKSIMVALLIELMIAEFRGRKDMRIVVVTTPQNVKQNGLKECAKSLLRFSPRHAVAHPPDADMSDSIRNVLANFRQPDSAKIRVRDFWSFRQFYTQYKNKSENEMKNVCLIIDECHELFNEKLKDRNEIFTIVSKAHKVFTLSGTPWRTLEQMKQQLSLLRSASSRREIDAQGSGLDELDVLRRYAKGCVSYVDGTKDLSTHPIDGGWSVERCEMSMEQLFNFSTRCSRQFKEIQSHIPKAHNSCQLAEFLTAEDKNTRGLVCTAFRHMQVAAGGFWGSGASGLKHILEGGDPSLEGVGKLAPKFERLCRAFQHPLHESLDPINTKHFVYSAYQSTITQLSNTR